MSPPVARLAAAYEKARSELLSQREPTGHWIGELATSALSTATAVSALSLVHREGFDAPIGRGLDWLARHQNSDGGWGDTDRSHSNIATTMLVRAAMVLSGRSEAFAGPLTHAQDYIERTGHLAALRARYGKDKTFAVPILTNCALAGLANWRDISALPFELACFPQSWYRFLQLPVVSYAIPALVAIGQAKYFRDPPRNPLVRWWRQRTVERSLVVLERMQPASGGYLEAIPLTSFVVMSLAATGRAEHAVTRRGVDFILSSIRPDGSWPIDTNLATWNTSLSLNALATGGEDLPAMQDSQRCLRWLLSCQQVERHPFTGAAPGGWGWSDLSGAVPDSDDTPGALLALSHWLRSASCLPEDRAVIRASGLLAFPWLLNLQNSDGGWPTFCRGWGKLPFDRSGADLTAHALRAIRAWEPFLDDARLKGRMRKACRRGLAYLERTQRPNGSWVPLWFGNQDQEAEENPVYGTAKVLLAYQELGISAESAAQRGRRWLEHAQHADGGWGATSDGRNDFPSSIEETALALDALQSVARSSQATAAESPFGGRTLSAGLDWLIQAVETSRYLEPSPIGFYFAKLWYYEKLYPVMFAVSALGRALREHIPPATPVRHPNHTEELARPAQARVG